MAQGNAGPGGRGGRGGQHRHQDITGVTGPRGGEGHGGGQARRGRRRRFQRNSDITDVAPGGGLRAARRHGGPRYDGSGRVFKKKGHGGTDVKSKRQTGKETQKGNLHGGGKAVHAEGAASNVLSARDPSLESKFRAGVKAGKALDLDQLKAEVARLTAKGQKGRIKGMGTALNAGQRARLIGLRRALVLALGGKDQLAAKLGDDLGKYFIGKERGGKQAPGGITHGEETQGDGINIGPDSKYPGGKIGPPLTGPGGHFPEGRTPPAGGNVSPILGGGGGGRYARPSKIGPVDSKYPGGRIPPPGTYGKPGGVVGHRSEPSAQYTQKVVDRIKSLRGNLTPEQKARIAKRMRQKPIGA